MSITILSLARITRLYLVGHFSQWNGDLVSACLKRRCSRGDRLLVSNCASSCKEMFVYLRCEISSSFLCVDFAELGPFLNGVFETCVFLLDAEQVQRTEFDQLKRNYDC